MFKLDEFRYKARILKTTKRFMREHDVEEIKEFEEGITKLKVIHEKLKEMFDKVPLIEEDSRLSWVWLCLYMVVWIIFVGILFFFTFFV